ncbi:MAG: DUF2892 domain-containing protein [Gemmatimonadaceae bacterium]
MKRNVGPLDRWIRAILGLGVLAMVFTGPETMWGYLGLIPLFTGIFGYCPLYSLFGWSTQKAVPQSGA